jgi:hypothetical protein
VQVVVALSLVLFVGVCSTVGLRLLWLARRTRRAAETLCGLGFTSIALIGWPASLASGHGLGTVAEMNVPAWAIGTAFVNAGIACFYVFTRRVFRPDAAWARALVLAAIAALVAGHAASLRAVAAAAPDASSFEVTWGATLVLQGATGVCFAWMAVEGFRHWRMSRRRVALGLADPIAARRFALWTLFALSTAGINVAHAAVHLAGVPGADSLVVHVASAVLGTLASAAVWLAFAPAPGGLERVRPRAASR